MYEKLSIRMQNATKTWLFLLPIRTGFLRTKRGLSYLMATWETRALSELKKKKTFKEKGKKVQRQTVLRFPSSV